MSIKIGINGFGRIGRLVFRAALKHPEVEVVAVNDLTDSATMAHLLKYDSVHGALDGTVVAKDDTIEVNNKTVAITSIKDPAMLRWREFGVDIVAECTGLFRDRENAEKHLTPALESVIISAPAKDPDITIVLGVSSNGYDPRASTCHTQMHPALPTVGTVAKVLLENFGIRSDLMTTIDQLYRKHQPFCSISRKDLRRAERAAALPSLLPDSRCPGPSSGPARSFREIERISDSRPDA